MQSHQFVSFKGRILLANLFQSSRSTFSRGSLLSFFAFKEGMVDTQISALGGWPTVSGRFVRQGDRAKKPLGEGTPAYGCRQSTLVQHERSVWME